MCTNAYDDAIDFEMCGFHKIQSRYLENETLFLLQIKKIIYYLSRATFMAKNSFVVVVTFKHAVQTKHKTVTEDFKIIGKGCKK